MMDRRSFIIGGLAGLVSKPAFANHTNHHRLILTNYDLSILTRTIYGEARGEHISGMYAVADSVFNRVTSDILLFKEDTSIARACLRKMQYSCWLMKHEMRSIDTKSEEYKKIKEIAYHSFVMYKKGVDYSRNATHYYKKHSRTPDWIHDMRKTTEIENHIFFKPKKAFGV